MNFDQTALMMATMTKYYTNRLMPEIDELTIDLWQKELSDIPWEVVEPALLSWVATHEFPPRVSQIREMSFKPMIDNMEEPEAAWGRLMKAIGKHGLYDKHGAHEELGDLLWSIVERFGWRFYCTMLETETTTAFAQFRNAYNVETKRQINRLLIPAPIRKALESKQISHIAISRTGGQDHGGMDKEHE